MKVSPRTAALTIALLGLFAATHAPTFASTRWDIPGEGPRQMRSPVAIALAADRVYVADFDNDRIQVFARSGQALLNWGATGSGPGQFRGPAGVAIGPDGSVVVTDLYNHRIQRFTSDGTCLASWSAGGDDAAPFGVAVDRNGRIYVTDLEAGRVGVWSTDGAPLATWGARGNGRGQMDEPWGIVVDGRGDVFVADHGNDRVQRFSGDGAWLGEWGGTGAEDGRLLGPMGLAVGRDGSVVASDLAGDRLRRFTPAGDLIAMSRDADASREFPALGLALDAGGDVFLADTRGQEIVRVPAALIKPPIAIPAAFAMTPIVQPLGRGPVTLDFAIPGPGTIGAEIFSIDGRRVHTVPVAACDAGAFRLTWDAVTDEGHRAPVGVYFVRAHFDDGVRRVSRSGRVVVLR